MALFSQHPQSVAIKPTPVVSGASIVVPVPVSKVETKTETPKPKSSKVAVNDVVVPKTEPEQDAQIDQNTITNINQEDHLNKLDQKTTDLQDKINNFPAPLAPSPTPTPVPPPAPSPTPTPDPVPVVQPKLIFDWENRPDLGMLGLLVKSVPGLATIKSFKYTLTNRQDGIEAHTQIKVGRQVGAIDHPRTPELAFDANLPAGYNHSDEYVLQFPIHTSALLFSPVAEAYLPSSDARFWITQITYQMDGENFDRTINVPN